VRRSFVGLVLVGLVALPLSASAQSGADDPSSASEPAPGGRPRTPPQPKRLETYAFDSCSSAGLGSAEL